MPADPPDSFSRPLIVTRTRPCKVQRNLAGVFDVKTLPEDVFIEWLGRAGG